MPYQTCPIVGNHSHWWWPLVCPPDKLPCKVKKAVLPCVALIVLISGWRSQHCPSRLVFDDVLELGKKNLGTRWTTLNFNWFVCSVYDFTPGGFTPPVRETFVVTISLLQATTLKQTHCIKKALHHQETWACSPLAAMRACLCLIYFEFSRKVTYESFLVYSKPKETTTAATITYHLPPSAGSNTAHYGLAEYD